MNTLDDLDLMRLTLRERDGQIADLRAKLAHAELSIGAYEAELSRQVGFRIALADNADRAHRRVFSLESQVADRVADLAACHEQLDTLARKLVAAESVPVQRAKPCRACHAPLTHPDLSAARDNTDSGDEHRDTGDETAPPLAPPHPLAHTLIAARLREIADLHDEQAAGRRHA